MKSLALLLVVVVCVAIGDGHCWGIGRPKEVDFKALNKHLVAKLGKKEGRAESLAVIRADMDTFKDPAMKGAAEVVLQLAEVNHKRQCDKNLMTTLRLVSAGGIKSYEDLKLKRRAQRLIRPELMMALEICEKHIEQTFPKLVEATDANLLKFSDVVSPNNEPKLLVKYKRLGTGRLCDILEQLAGDDPNTKDPSSGQLLIHKNKDIFNYAFEKYLVEPCKQLTGAFGDFFRAARAIANIRSKAADFTDGRFEHFRRMARTTGVCRQMMAMSNDKKLVESVFAAPKH